MAAGSFVYDTYGKRLTSQEDEDCDGVPERGCNAFTYQCFEEKPAGWEEEQVDRF